MKFTIGNQNIGTIEEYPGSLVIGDVENDGDIDGDEDIYVVFGQSEGTEGNSIHFNELQTVGFE